MINVSFPGDYDREGPPPSLPPPVAENATPLLFAADEYPSVSLLDLTSESCGLGGATNGGEDDDDNDDDDDDDDNDDSGAVLFPRVLFPDEEGDSCEMMPIDDVGAAKDFATVQAGGDDDEVGTLVFPEELGDDEKGGDRHNEKQSCPFNLDESRIVADVDDDDDDDVLEVETSLIVGGTEDSVEMSLVVTEPAHRDDVQQSFTRWADGVMETSLLSTSVSDVTESFVESLCVSKLERSCGSSGHPAGDGTEENRMLDGGGPCNIVSPCGAFREEGAGNSCAATAAGAADSSFADAAALWRDLESILGSAFSPTGSEIDTLRGLTDVAGTRGGGGGGGGRSSLSAGGAGDENLNAAEVGGGAVKDDDGRVVATSSSSGRLRRRRPARNRAGEPMRLRVERVRRLRLRMEGGKDSPESGGGTARRRPNNNRPSHSSGGGASISRAWSVDDHEVPTTSTVRHTSAVPKSYPPPPHFQRIVGDCLEPSMMSFEDPSSAIVSAQSRSDDSTGDDCRNSIDSDNDGSLCYDSDPGEVTSRSQRVRSTRTHDKSTENMEDSRVVQNGDVSHSSDEDECRPMPTMDGSNANERAVLLSVQETLNQTLHLTWHPSEKSGGDDGGDIDRMLTAPRCVRLWFERGYSMGYGKSLRLIEPKLAWRDAMHEGDSLSSQKDEAAKCCGGQFALLDVCRVLPTSSAASVRGGVVIDRSKYPTARASCSFIVRTVDDEEFLFEARSEEERNRLIYRWKAAIARLASVIIVENSEAMKKEFFLPQSFLRCAERLCEEEVESPK